MSAQYFAQLDDNNLVVNVHVVTQQFLDDNSNRYLGTWVETFIDVPSKTYAGIGYTYNALTQNFEPPVVTQSE